MFKIQDANSKVFNKVTTPAAVFDKESGTLMKIGEFDIMRQYFEEAHKAYTAGGFPEMAQALVFMELPQDQDEIDKVFQISGYIKRLYNTTQLPQ